MFKLKPDPTFDATITIVGQGREQKLNVTFRHMTRSAYADLLKDITEAKVETADAILQVVEKWNADGELNRENVKTLLEYQPGADWAILTAYGDALTVARKGN